MSVLNQWRMSYAVACSLLSTAYFYKPNILILQLYKICSKYYIYATSNSFLIKPHIMYTCNTVLKQSSMSYTVACSLGLLILPALSMVPTRSNTRSTPGIIVFIQQYLYTISIIYIRLTSQNIID